MNKKISLGAAVTLIIIAVSLTVSVTMVIAMRQFNYKLSNVNQRQTMFDYITEVDNVVRQHYVGDVNEESLRASLAKGYLDGINDKYAAYLTSSEYKKEAERLSGKCTGLGLEVERDNAVAVISAVHKDSAADKAGMQKDDIITNLNGTAVTAADFDTINSTLDKAEKTMITVSRGSQSIAFDISPSTYTVNSVTSRLIGATGYIRITDFFNNTPDQFKEAYTAMEAQGAQNYVFDLRYNQGGSISAACSVIGYLIPRGTFAYRTDNEGAVTDLSSEGTYEISKPSVTLVNESTAGEAELFAGVMSRFNKTTVIGVQTAGRGLIQEYYNVSSDGAAIKLSVASLSFVDGSALEGSGIKPGITVGLTNSQEEKFAFLTEKDDPQLITALNTLKYSTNSNAAAYSVLPGSSDSNATGTSTDTTAQAAQTQSTQASGSAAAAQ